MIENMFNKIPPELTGAILAVIMSTLRVIYDKEETRFSRILIESLICGALSLTASSAITAAGLNAQWAIFAGGVIGYFGSATVRAFALKLIEAKIKT